MDRKPMHIQDHYAELSAEIEGQEILLEVLERDGHDVTKERERLQSLREQHKRESAPRCVASSDETSQSGYSSVQLP